MFTGWRTVLTVEHLYGLSGVAETMFHVERDIDGRVCTGVGCAGASPGRGSTAVPGRPPSAGKLKNGASGGALRGG